MIGLCMFLLISKACPMLHAQVFLQSLPPTTAPASLLNCNYTVQFQSQRTVLCQAFPATKAPVSPTRPSVRMAITVLTSISRTFVLHRNGVVQGTAQMPPWLGAGPVAAARPPWQE